MNNNNYMQEDFHKNSLLGQLEKNGMLQENSTDGDFLPFGSLSKGFETNVFESVEENVEPEEKQVMPKIIKKRLNELDNNLFQESSFLNMEDSELSVEEKIAKLKTLIKKIDDKLFMLEDSDDLILIEKLKSKKEALVDSLSLLSTEKNEVDVSIADDTKKNNLWDKTKQVENIFFKCFPILRKIILVKKALSKLTMLNENAREAIQKKIPYGESESRYNDFVAYLNCANIIHSKLTKKM